MKPTPIANLQVELLADLRHDARGRSVPRILADYAARHADWRSYALFDDEVYTRNLVGRNEEFEMLVLCWNLRQASPIHNHAGQQCWMVVLEGEIEEEQFSFPRRGRAGPLAPRRTKTFAQGQVAYIDDEIALHRVQPIAGTTGITLHVYSKPIDECQVYDEATGQVVARRLEYHSVEAGKPVRSRRG